MLQVVTGVALGRKTRIKHGLKGDIVQIKIRPPTLNCDLEPRVPTLRNRDDSTRLNRNHRLLSSRTDHGFLTIDPPNGFCTPLR